jgi:hypothetical protein
VSKRDIYVGFSTTGIQIHVHVRPFSEDKHGNIMKRHPNATIPGSLTTHICIPDDNESIINVKGLAGTVSQDFADDFMLRDGTTIDRPRGTTPYCEETWCAAETESIFVYEDGFTFSDYDECSTPARRVLRELEEDAPITCADIEGTDACEEICSTAANYGHCVEEFDLGDIDMAVGAIEEQNSFEQAALEALKATFADDAACCSNDFATFACDYTITKVACLDMAGYAWFPHGKEAYLDMDDNMMCAGEGEACGEMSCCQDLSADPTWSMTCSSGTCALSTTGSRRLKVLEDFKLVRPDLKENMKFQPLHSEL